MGKEDCWKDDSHNYDHDVCLDLFITPSMNVWWCMNICMHGCDCAWKITYASVTAHGWGYMRKCDCTWNATCMSMTAHGKTRAWQTVACTRATVHRQLCAWDESDNAWTVTCMSVTMHGQLHAWVWLCMNSYTHQTDCTWIITCLRMTVHGKYAWMSVSAHG